MLAQGYAKVDSGSIKAYSEMLENWYAYCLRQIPCWFIMSPWNDGVDDRMLRSGRIIGVSKMNGKMVYDG